MERSFCHEESRHGDLARHPDRRHAHTNMKQVAIALCASLRWSEGALVLASEAFANQSFSHVENENHRSSRFSVLSARAATGAAALGWTDFSAGPVQLEARSMGSIDFGDVGEAPPIFAQAVDAPLAYVADAPELRSRARAGAIVGQNGGGSEGQAHRTEQGQQCPILSREAAAPAWPSVSRRLTRLSRARRCARRLRARLDRRLGRLGSVFPRRAAVAECARRSGLERRRGQPCLLLLVARLCGEECRRDPHRHRGDQGGRSMGPSSIRTNSRAYGACPYPSSSSR